MNTCKIRNIVLGEGIPKICVFGLEVYKEAEVSTIQGVMDVLVGDR